MLSCILLYPLDADDTHSTTALASLCYMKLLCLAFWFPFRKPFRVSSSRKQAVQPVPPKKGSKWSSIGKSEFWIINGKPPANPRQTEHPNLHGFELYWPSSKSTQLLFQVIKAIIKQFRFLAKWAVWKETCDDHSDFQSTYKYHFESRLLGNGRWRLCVIQ